MSDEEISNLKKAIDAIDRQLLALMAKRMNICNRLASAKERDGVEEEANGKTIASLKSINNSPDISSEAIEKIWQVIIQESK